MGLETIDDLVALPLGPHEVVVFPIVEVTHGPPEARLETSPNQHRVVATTNVVLVRSDRSLGELDVGSSVALVDLI